MARRPYDDKGRFVPAKCELCGCGELRHDEGKTWRCDGLLDPEDPNKELAACHAYHVDGEPVQSFEKPRARGVPVAAPQSAPSKPLTRCAASSDGECSHPQCPQIRDGEPAKSGRHCPIDNREDY